MQKPTIRTLKIRFTEEKDTITRWWLRSRQTGTSRKALAANYVHWAAECCRKSLGGYTHTDVCPSPGDKGSFNTHLRPPPPQKKKLSTPQVWNQHQSQRLTGQLRSRQKQTTAKRQIRTDNHYSHLVVIPKNPKIIHQGAAAQYNSFNILN